MSLQQFPETHPVFQARCKWRFVLPKSTLAEHHGHYFHLVQHRPDDSSRLRGPFIIISHCDTSGPPRPAWRVSPHLASLSVSWNHRFAQVRYDPGERDPTLALGALHPQPDSLRVDTEIIIQFRGLRRRNSDSRHLGRAVRSGETCRKQ
ncbi:hypothetical protein M0R45_037617 [Rubus argutus]|uniref:Uncharacterized protein n=1 Tax=Rubus argutus TaxID=59490 RepID=A0AAW1VZH0_RUBAR